MSELDSPGTTAPETEQRRDPFQVDRGQLTFDTEGTEGGRYHSRGLHWPGSASGVTIGRGYDMKERSRAEILGHMQNAEVPAGVAARLAAAAGLTGRNAQSFVNNNRDIEITPEQQQVLFSVVFDEKHTYAAGRVRAWTGTDLNAADPIIRDIIVDLFYRGDMTRAKWNANDLATIVANSDFDRLLVLLQTRSLWSNVDTNRYTRRIEYLQNRGRQAGGGAAAATAPPATGAAARPAAAAATAERPPTEGRSLQASVGRGATNLRPDVFTVQQRLTDRGVSVGGVDGRVGRNTIAGIERFQASFMRNPDGRIDVGGRSAQRLFGSTDPVAASPAVTGGQAAPAQTPLPGQGPAAPQQQQQQAPQAVATAGDLSRVRSGVRLTAALETAIRLVSPYLPAAAVVTSGLRSDEDQAALINRYFAQRGGPASITNVEQRRQWLVARGMKIARVGTSMHRSGLAFDLSGGSLTAIQAAVLRCAEERRGQFRYSRSIFERANNCFHVEVSG